MKKNLAVFLTVLFVFSAPAFAREIKGFVDKIDFKSRTFLLDCNDDDVVDEVYYSEVTKFDGLKPEEIREGMYLVVQGEQDPFFQDWSAAGIALDAKRSKPYSMPTKEDLTPMKAV